MCTAVTYQNGDHYFGRTLDYDISYSEQVVFTPRKFPLPFRSMGVQKAHYAILGMACVQERYPLYFDGFNEKGLAMAGLNFVGSAHYTALDHQNQQNRQTGRLEGKQQNQNHEQCREN